MARRKSKKPAKLIVGPVKARAIRGPHKDGSGRWYWRAEVYSAGKTETVWTGWAVRDAASLRLAELIAAGGLEGPKRREANEIHTLGDLMEVWVGMQEDRRDLSPHTLHAYTNGARHLKGTLGEVRIDRVDLSTLQRYRDARLRTAASGTVDLELGILRMAWRWGRELGACPARELPRVRLKVKAARNRRTPTRADIARVDEHLSGWPRVAFQLLFGTGARIGAISRLKWRDVDLDSGLIRLVGKTGAREVPIAPELVALLREWGGDTPTPGAWVLGVRPVSVGGLRVRYLPRACEAAGVEPFTPHGLRRAAVDALLRAGVDVGTAAALLGHSPKVMLEHYRKATIDDRRRAVTAARLGTLPAGTVIPFNSKDKETG